MDPVPAHRMVLPAELSLLTRLSSPQCKPNKENGETIIDLGYVAENKALKLNGHYPHAMNEILYFCMQGMFSIRGGSL